MFSVDIMLEIEPQHWWNSKRDCLHEVIYSSFMLPLLKKPRVSTKGWLKSFILIITNQWHFCLVTFTLTLIDLIVPHSLSMPGGYDCEGISFLIFLITGLNPILTKTFFQISVHLSDCIYDFWNFTTECWEKAVLDRCRIYDT